MRRVHPLWTVLRGAGGSAPAPPGPTVQEQQLQQEQVDIAKQQLQIAQGQQAYASAVTPLALAQGGYNVTAAPAGAPPGAQGDGSYVVPIGGTNYTVAQSPGAKALADLNTQVATASGKQALAAMQGNIQIPQGVEDQIARGKQQLTEQLQNQLGPAWQQSDAGIRAMAEYDRNADIIRSNIQFGYLNSANAISLSTQQQALQTQEHYQNVATQAMQPYLLSASALGGAAGTANTAAQLAQQERFGAFNLALQGQQIGSQMTTGLAGSSMGMLGNIAIGTGMALA